MKPEVLRKCCPENTKVQYCETKGPGGEVTVMTICWQGPWSTADPGSWQGSSLGRGQAWPRLSPEATRSQGAQTQPHHRLTGRQSSIQDRLGHFMPWGLNSTPSEPTLWGKAAPGNPCELWPTVSIVHECNRPTTVTHQRKRLTFLIWWGFDFRRKCSTSSSCQLLPKP